MWLQPTLQAHGSGCCSAASFAPIRNDRGCDCLETSVAAVAELFAAMKSALE
jgi:hypothetical protein